MIKQNSPQGSCNCSTLRQAARYLTAAYDQALAESGLRLTQFSILYKLATRGPQTITDLSAAMAMDRTTLGRNLRLLEEDGLLRLGSGADRRERLADLTAMGRRKLDAAYPLWQKAQEQFESRFGTENAEKLRKTLGSVLNTGLDPWGHPASNLGEAGEAGRALVSKRNAKTASFVDSV
jgi:DNA-binding MarR family transcriptional regulator